MSKTEVFESFRDNEQWLEALEKIKSLEEQALQINREIDAVRARDDSGGTEAAAVALLNGEGLEVATATAKSQELETLHQKRRVIEKAISLQRQAAEKIRVDLSNAVLQEAGVEITETKLEIAKAFMELGKAIGRQENLLQRLRVAGVRINQQPAHMQPHRLERMVGALADDWSLKTKNGPAVSEYLREMSQHWGFKIK